MVYQSIETISSNELKNNEQRQYYKYKPLAKQDKEKNRKNMNPTHEGKLKSSAFEGWASSALHMTPVLNSSRQIWYLG